MPAGLGQRRCATAGTSSCARAAGRFGIGLLSIGATQRGGFDALKTAWDICESKASEHGKTVDRASWRLVGPMHLAPTEEQARRDVEFGLADWVDYFKRVAALPLAPDTSDTDELVDAMNDSGLAVIGTPEMAVAQIARLQEQSGGFGSYLIMANDWADREHTQRSYELFAREVMPHFQDSATSLVSSRDWAAANHEVFVGQMTGAIAKAISEHYDEQAARAQDDVPAVAHRR